MADGLNRVMLLGNLGADPELRFTQAGQAVLNLRLATTESYLDKDKVRRERTDWHSVVIWGKRGEALGKILTKGSSLFVEGSLRTSSYDDREGQKRYKTEVVAREVLLTGRGGARGAAGGDHDGDGGDEGAGDHDASQAGPAPGAARGPATAKPTSDPTARFSPRKWDGKDFKGSNFSACSPAFLRVLGEAMTYSGNNPTAGKESYAEGNLRDGKLALEWAAYLDGAGGAGGGARPAARQGGGGGGYSSRSGGRAAPAAAAAAPADDDYAGDYGGYGGGSGGTDDDIPF